MVMALGDTELAILKRGVDPYADADYLIEAFKASRIVRLSFNMDVVEGAAAVNVFLVSPIAGEVLKMVIVNSVILATADEEFTVEIGGTPVVGLAVTHPTASSAAGDVVVSEIASGVATAVVAKDGAIEITKDGASTATGFGGYLEIHPI